MVKWLLVGLGLSLGLLSGGTQAQPPANDALRHDLTIARQKVYPALVNISVVYRYFAEGRTQRSPAGGSGVIISADGYVITNFHVAGHTTHITCTLANGEVMEAKSVADDPLTDLSILKLKLDKRADPKAPLAFATLGNSDSLQVGDFVIAMGNPLMLSSSMTLGVISNKTRVFTDFTGTQLEDMELGEGEKTGLFTRWLQHDALILPGNSGGPLVNLKGEVIGINELGGSGVGFAIPSNLASQVFQQVLKKGKVERGWLGVRILPVGKLGRKEGALVAAVSPTSPAAKAGILPGDILLSVNEKPVKVRFFEEVPLFHQQIAELVAGSSVKIALLRNEKPLTLTATIALMPPSVGAEEEFLDQGITVQDITEEMRAAYYLPDKQGVLVTGVRPGFPFEAAKPAIAAGDVIRSVNGTPTPNRQALRAALAASKEANLVVFVRNEERLLTVVKGEAPPAQPNGGELPQAWIGIKTQVLVPEIAKALGLVGKKGYLVTQVYPWTEAGKSGIQTGDVVTALNGSKLDASRPQDSEDLVHAVQELSVGEKAQLTALRGGKPLTLSVKLEPTPTSVAQAKSSRQKEFEFTVRELTLMDRIDNHWSREQKGLLVTEVVNGGWAAIAGLHVEDLLVTVNGQTVDSVDSFKQIMALTVRAHPKIVTLFIRRDHLTHFVFLEPDWSKFTAAAE